MIVLKVTFHDGLKTEIKRLPMSRLPNELTFDEVRLFNLAHCHYQQNVQKIRSAGTKIKIWLRWKAMEVSAANVDIAHALNLNTTFKIYAFTDKIKDIPTKPDQLLFQKSDNTLELKEILGKLQSSFDKLLAKVEKDVRVDSEKKEPLAPISYAQFETNSQPAQNYGYQTNSSVNQTPIQPIQTPITQQNQMNQQISQPLQHNQQGQINQQLNQPSQMNQMHQNTPTSQQPQATQEKKQLRLYMHPPSIPTRFQTIHYEDSEKKAFASTSRRFESKTNDLPGPGYYARAAEKLELVMKDASVSKRGYGVGFASQQKRFMKPPTDLETDITVSPAQYFPKSPKYSGSLQNSLSAVFRNPANTVPGKSFFVSSNTMVRTKRGFKATPGPGEYSVDRIVVRPPLGDEKSSIFKSRTSRSHFGAQSSIPAPGSYDVDKSSKSLEPKVYGAISSFRSSQRFQHTYLTVRKIKIVNISDPPALPEEPLSNQVCIPGSGQTPIAFPSPGKYNIVRGADATHKSSPATRSIFMSKSERFAQPLNKEVPGPGYYHPFPHSKSRSYHLNLEENWT
ncbi:hypothetical protein HDV06_000953 [Boothiomyces sp. JEL0866]|nr:hypothetical protein HDV06_000953 [Boothiomyces sp. JEL0866]